MTPHEHMNDALFVLTVVASGLIAGQMLAIALSTSAARQLPETSWTRRFQVEDKLFTKTMPPSLLTPLVGMALSAWMAHGLARWLFGCATLLTLAVLFITMVVEVPINNMVQSWTAGSAPPDWTAVRDKWLNYHFARTGAGGLAFLAAAAALNVPGR